ncbi:hypothetical protein P3T40_002518 [Paraburkholderia sp. EB58]|jgi:hypothetical protein
MTPELVPQEAALEIRGDALIAQADAHAAKWISVACVPSSLRGLGGPHRHAR